MDFQAEYRSKLRTPAEAVRAVKNGDWGDYTSGLGFPPLLDAALAARRDELHDVKVRGNLCAGPVQIVECDPEQAHFLYHTWHCSAYERRLCDRGLCYFTPMIFRNLAWYYREFLTVNVAMASVAPMDRHGYFNLSAVTGVSRAILDRADIVILEVNEHLPRLRGGFDEVIHISDVDMVVLPGGIPGTPNLAANKTVTETCAAFAKAGRKVAAICAAPSMPSSTMKRSWWMATSPPAMGWAVPSPLHWNWCASWPVRQRRSVSGTPLRIGTEKGDTVCALLPAVCRTAWKTRRFYRRMGGRSGR